MCSEIRERERDRDIQGFLKNTLVDVGGPNPGDAKGQDKDAAETGGVSFHVRRSGRRTVAGDRKQQTEMEIEKFLAFVVSFLLIVIL